MTVINKEKTKCVNPTSATPSDTESLHIPSDSDSSFNESIEVIQRPPLRNHRIAYDSYNLTRKNCGKRKLQRLVNFANLQVLNENEELDLHNVNLVENYGSPLTRLLQNSDALKYWNDFIELSEEEQENVISNLKCASSNNHTRKYNYPIRRMLAKIKKKFRVKTSLSVEIKKLEVPLLNFFKSNKDSVYVVISKSSLERLLLLVIAQYHNFKLISEVHDCDRHFQICIDDDWKPKDIEFYDIIQQKLHH